MSATHPWLKFYPRDWRGDQALRVVSMAARGFWIECLSIMHEASPYGHLLVNGKTVDDDVLARLVGATVAEVRALRDELLEAGVADQTRAGVLVSRRMMRDENRAKKGRKAVKKRWEQPAENKAEIAAPNRSPTHPPTTQKPEARYQKEESPKPQAPVNLPADVRSVLEEGGFVTPPPDIALLGEWKALGADMQTDILPSIRKVRANLSKPPFKLKVFDAAIREKLAADQAEIVRLEGVGRRMQQMDEAQAPRLAAGGVG